MSVGSELWRTVRHRQWLVFVIFFVLCSLAGIVLPPTPRHLQTISTAERLLMLGVGLSLLMLSLSLSFYFADSWTGLRTAANKTTYRIWLGFETLVGVPFAFACVAFGGVCLWIVFVK